MSKTEDTIQAGAGEHLSPTLIKRYVAGELPARQMHRVERHCLDCQLCAQALEGFSNRNFRSYLGKDLVELNQRLSGRLQRGQRIHPFGWQAWGIAATFLILMFASVYFLTERLGRKPEMAAASRIQLPENPDTLIIYQRPAIVLVHARPQPEPPRVSAPGVASFRRSRRPATDPALQSSPLYAPRHSSTDSSPAPHAVAVGPVQEKPAAPVAQPESLALSGRVPLRSDKATADDFAKKKSRMADEPVNNLARSKSETAPGQISINGVVKAGDDASPLPGVSVSVKGSSLNTSTDAEGNFSLHAPAGSTLVFNFIGMESREVRVEGNLHLEVTLNPDVKSLSEVVVVGYGTRAKGQPRPEGGFKALDQYLNRHLQYPQQAREMQVTGTVSVEFTVEPDGSLSDFRVVKGLGYGCDEEAIRALQAGPRWNPAVENNQPVRKKVRTRVKFGR